MDPITFTVRKVNQAASGGSYVVGYTAEVEFTDNPTRIDIEVLSTKPIDADPKLVEYAIEHTREGFSEILRPLNRGAKVRLTNLLLHDIDYKPRRQREFSASHLAAALDSRKNDIA